MEGIPKGMRELMVNQEFMAAQTAGESPLENNRIKKKFLNDNSLSMADKLYDWASIYLSRKEYRQAKICLRGIIKKNCWDLDETLKPGTYSFLASCYFNEAILKGWDTSAGKGKLQKAKESTEIADECVLESTGIEVNCKTGAFITSYGK